MTDRPAAPPDDAAAEVEAFDPRDATIEILKDRMRRMTTQVKRLQALESAGQDELDLREEVVRLREAIAVARKAAATANDEKERADKAEQYAADIKKRVDFLEKQWLESRHAGGPAAVRAEEFNALRERFERATREVQHWRTRAEEMSLAAVEQARRASEPPPDEAAAAPEDADRRKAMAVLEAENRVLREQMAELEQRMEEALGDMRRERLSHKRLQAELKAYKSKFGETADY